MIMCEAIPRTEVSAPPSVLPDISPTRGESGSRRAALSKQDGVPIARLPRWALSVLHPLSLLVAEMSGRTEGAI